MINPNWFWKYPQIQYCNCHCFHENIMTLPFIGVQLGIWFMIYPMKSQWKHHPHPSGHQTFDSQRLKLPFLSHSFHWISQCLMVNCPINEFPYPIISISITHTYIYIIDIDISIISHKTLFPELNLRPRTQVPQVPVQPQVSAIAAPPQGPPPCGVSASEDSDFSMKNGGFKRFKYENHRDFSDDF